VILLSHYRKPIEHFLKDLEAITLNDIASTAKNIISSPLTMASWGNGMFVTNHVFLELFSQ
jgi:processing peptidase subunit alpha